ncbi:Uncharacterised protein [Serratia quinivorans]|uniref:Uncharacterized protein n=1 Tax=Serratia quinivorans TaxID=137545 RepID=A0A379YDL0_9GAMM|nr:Uncharacterised protein [Serratia quinivorans]SUI43783.1 Uncharacterised protein [Serratia quinivorans]
MIFMGPAFLCVRMYCRSYTLVTIAYLQSIQSEDATVGCLVRWCRNAPGLHSVILVL